jgi:hypothetical protein
MTWIDGDGIIEDVFVRAPIGRNAFSSRAINRSTNWEV